mmetsp:Transcript_5405/g.7073  ORF Transcript_5405/g.7073 Transcript_5405/m.7073 type:complete len:140 (+) Transcript_5405:1516-1935(+)
MVWIIARWRQAELNKFAPERCDCVVAVTVYARIHDDSRLESNYTSASYPWWCCCSKERCLIQFHLSCQLLCAERFIRVITDQLYYSRMYQMFQCCLTGGGVVSWWTGLQKDYKNVSGRNTSAKTSLTKVIKEYNRDNIM